MEVGGRKMRKKERNYEVKINGIPQLNDMPKDLLDLLCAALLDSILSEKESGSYDVEVVKGGTSHIRAEESVFQRDGFPVIVLGCIEKGLRIAEGRTPETNAFPFCLGNAFRLPRTCVFPFVFRHERQYLQYDVRDEFADEGTWLCARVQKRHIQDEDIRPNLIGDTAPFFDDHVVTASQPVYGLDDEQVAASEFAYKAQVVLPFKVLTAFLVAEDMFRGDTEGTESG